MKTALVAICCNEKNVKEWCDYHRKLGFDAIYIALNNCSAEYVEHCCSLEIPGVYFTEFNPPDCDPTKRLGAQFVFYNAWLKTFGTHFDFAAFIDVDEYIYLSGQTLQEFLQSHLDSPVIALNWKFFASPEEHPEGPSESLLQRFRYSQRGKNQHVKCIANLKKIAELGLSEHAYFVNPHLISHPASQLPTVDECGTRVIGPYNQHWQDNDVFIAHFYSKTKEEFAQKISRGRPDCSRASSAQYFLQEQHMQQERARCNLPEVHDTRLLDFMRA